MTGAEILAHVKRSAPDEDDEDWADVCAAAIEAAIADRLGDGAVTPSASKDAQLVLAARNDGAAAYLSRKAPHGILAVGPDGDTVRLGKAILRECDPILYSIAPGIG